MSNSSDSDGGRMNVGSNVVTKYGVGKVMWYREDDGMYCIDMVSWNGKVFAKESSMYLLKNGSQRQKPSKRTMELNEAYEAFEKMRRFNLELECNEVGIIFTKNNPIDHEECTKCILQRAPNNRKDYFTYYTSLNKYVDKSRNLMENANTQIQTNNYFPRIRKIRAQHRRRAATPCLICGSPTCYTHSSSEFRRENITICMQCVKMFDVDDQSHFDENQVEHMIDLYDRASLLLKYMEQFMPDIASSLETSRETQNKVGLGSSSVGLVSGALGVAAAATILTTAGTSLLIASLVFGGSATFVSAGSEVVNYYSEPNKLADKIIALHGMVQSVLSNTNNIRDNTLVPYITTALNKNDYKQLAGNNSDGVKDKANKTAIGLRVSASAATGVARLSSNIAMEAVESSSITGARYISRVSSSLSKTAQVARFAGGALSAATILLEGYQMQKTITQIRAGNPCDKADTIRKIMEELPRLPRTSTIDGMCQCYLKVVMGNRERRQHAFDQAALDLKDTMENDLELIAEVVTSLEEEEMETKEQPLKPDQTWGHSGDLSLFDRIRLYKERQAREEAAIGLVC